MLLDVSHELPALKRATGLSHWLVKSNGELFATWEEAEAKQASLFGNHVISQRMASA